jgi:phosphatidylinositol alpha-1,6-mannosyltransferase
LNALRLLIVSTEFPPGPGGIGAQAFHLASGLCALGWQVAVLSPQDYASEDEIQVLSSAHPFRIFRQHHLSNTVLEGANRLGDLFRLGREYQPDILLASGARAVWLAALYARVSQCRWAAIAHGGIEFGTRLAWERAVNRWAYNRPQAVVCVSQFARRRMLDFGVHVPWVEVITNGADERLFKPLDHQVPAALRRQWGLEKAEIILTVGSLTERKGQEIVIRALPGILKTRPQAHYVMAGLPHIQAKLERLAQELGIQQHVHFLGRVGQATLVAAYNACDLFAMTSRHSEEGDAEGYGIAVIEAALCGKPAVVSDGSGLAEAVTHEQTGVLVPENDSPAVSQAVVRLLGDAAYRERLGQQARRQALSRQTWTSRVALYDCFLREILTG